MTDDDEVLTGELVPAGDPVPPYEAIRRLREPHVEPGPDVEPPIVRHGDPRCDAETRVDGTWEGTTIGRVKLTVRAQCDLPPDHDGQHRVTMPDRVTEYRW
ncbi:hypothetical protein SEA_LENNON_71 [Gordonia phage Lennon]|uniref:Uncharacterized protein n=3 Tax=Vividuovirus TaxID=2560251 RepID=A0A3G3M8W6_9CAUD|nr:hypothetical protein FDI74_gp71 [Gordonia phage Lennon]YP_010099146.1 hypothetical protein KNU17_gp69 [Gordonia phage Ailee]YP_010099566.1 hypothetical protein KNU22_gp67 [Gordonia phage Stultus]UYL87746.1 hypothetical protein SEA_SHIVANISHOLA_71 [Gordonia phage Shivanishola]ATN90264.1 hypothetical protein SEA_LENNON_71 [Gordonia phage Lennon]AYR02537.1 hypothetical protein SEA_AILEE_69 [Gordonia phage Ailee]AYR03537.1 hypothetical protein SEA_STULTUS_67 [Gordonia phage Stultus]